MKRKKVISILCFLFIGILITLYYTSADRTPYFEKGRLDVADHLSEEKVISLDGEWAFYWQMLLEPADFKSQKLPEPAFINLPSTWGDMVADRDKEYATYRLIMTNLKPNESYGLIKKNIRVACKIFVNGQLVFQDGTPSNNPASEIMGNTPSLILFKPDSSSADIVIQVSDFGYYRGGIVESIRFGKILDVQHEYLQNVIFEAIVFSTLMVIGLILLILVIVFDEFRKREPASYFLPVSVMSFAIINGLLSQRLLKLLFYEMTTETQVRIEYVAVCLFFISLFISIYLMDRKLLSKVFVVILSGMYSILGVMVIFIPLENQWIWPLIGGVTLLVLPIVLVIILYRFIFNKGISIKFEEHILLIFIMLLTNIYNLDLILFTAGYRQDMKLALISAAMYGVIWFMLIAFRVYIVNIKLIDTEGELQVALDELEVHRNEILAAYEHLEIEVMERTEDLSKANEQLRIEVELRQRNESKIERLAFYDQLTDIPNRRFFYDHIESKILYSQEHDGKFALLFLDLDGFKAVNDSCGHDCGDRLLQMVADTLKNMIGPDDFVARLGGDEFVIILNQTNDIEFIKVFCDRLLEKASEKMDVYGNHVSVGVSMGIAIYPEDGFTSNELIKCADDAMYKAKYAGKNRYFFSNQ